MLLSISIAVGILLLTVLPMAYWMRQDRLERERSIDQAEDQSA